MSAELPHSDNVIWDGADVRREERCAAVGQTAGTVWLTGLPGSGKSAIAKALEARLIGCGHPAYRLDGDNLRHGLCGDLGFSVADRAENVRRVAHVSRMFAESGVIALVAVVSPYRVDRELARGLHDDAGLRFTEVFVDTPLQVCETRDPKGLYARARAGAVTGVTGIDDPYEPSEEPELHVSHPTPIDEVVERLVARLLPPDPVAAVPAG